MAYVAAFHLRFAPAVPPWRPRVRGMRQDWPPDRMFAGIPCFNYTTKHLVLLGKCPFARPCAVWKQTA